MQYNNYMQREDPIFGVNKKTEQPCDPLFNNTGDVKGNDKKSSCYFNNESSTNLDERISAVINKKDLHKRYFD